jgi:hypothetical protein
MPLDSAATHTRYDEDLAFSLASSNSVNLLRQDALDDSVTVGIWLARQLDYVVSKVYMRLLPEINANRLVPDDTSIPEWIETVTIVQYDAVGMAKIIANYADDLPRVDVRGAAKTVTVKTLGDSYGYNVNELRASRATGMGLDQRKADTARRAMDLKIAQIKLTGDPDFGLPGLFNHPNIPEAILPNPGDWGALTGDQIYANLIFLAGAYQQQTLGVHTANFLELAPAAYIAATTKLITSATPMTPLSAFSAAFPSITTEMIWELKGAGYTGIGTPGVDMALLYERNTDNLAHYYVMPFTQLPPDARNLEIVVDCMARSGGVQIFYPLSLLKAMTT